MSIITNSFIAINDNDIIETNEFNLSFNNIKYIIKISKTLNHIIFKCLTNNQYYQNILSMQEIISLYPGFSKYNNINDFYLYIITVVRDKNLQINKINSNISIKINLLKIPNSNQLIEIKLNKIGSFNKDEEILSMINKLNNEILFLKSIQNESDSKIKSIMNEIKEIKQDNCKKDNEIKELKSKINNIIDNDVTESNQYKNEINSTSENNWNTSSIISGGNIINNNSIENVNEESNSTKNANEIIDEHKSAYYLNQFNSKYKTNITGNETDLNLSRNYCYIANKYIGYGINEIEDLGNEGLCLLSRIKFNHLQKLYLGDNSISEITILGGADCSQLKELYLGFNVISDINCLARIEFTQLEELYLGYNNISDINVLEKVKFYQLQRLYLNGNKITDISVFGRVKLSQLHILFLSRNNISDIRILGKITFDKLQKLNLIGNKIDYLNNENQSIITLLKKRISKVEC